MAFETGKIKAAISNANNYIRGHINKSSLAAIFVLALLLLGVALTVWKSQSQTSISSRASDEKASSDKIDILTDQLLQSFMEYEQAVQSGKSTSTPSLVPSLSPSPILSPTLIPTQSAKITSPATASAVQGDNTSKEIEEKENKMILIAQARKDLLLQKIETNPQEFLDKATLADKRGQFPEKVKALVEKKVDTEGLLSLVHIDYFKEKKSEKEQYDYLIRQPDSKDQAYEVHFVKNPPQVLSGSQVKVKGGVGIDQEIAVANAGGTGSNSLQVISAAVFTPPLGEQKTAVLLANFSDRPNDKPFTPENIRTKMFSNTSTSVNDYYKETSFNKVSFSGDVLGWYTIPYTIPSQNCSYYHWGLQAEQKAKEAGINLNNYQRIIYVFPDDDGCQLGYGGLGEIGNGTFITHSWILNSDVRVFEHELGHNLGVHHANSIVCNNIGNYTNCDEYEYGDLYDVMGNFWYNNSSFHFNGPHKLALGWIPESNINKSVVNGIYTLAPLETLGSDTQILQMPKFDTGFNTEYFFVSYRQKQGLDSGLPANIVNGASIHIWRPDANLFYQTKFLKAVNTGGSNGQDVLSDGATFYDRINNVSIKQLNHDANGVTVEVSLSYLPSPTPPATPTPTPVLPKISGIDPKSGSIGTTVAISGSGLNQPNNLLIFYNSQAYQYIHESELFERKNDSLKFTIPDTVCAYAGALKAPLSKAAQGGGGGCTTKTPLGIYSLIFYNYDLGSWSNAVNFEVLPNPISWKTDYASLKASDFYIKANNKIFKPNSSLDIHSNPGDSKSTTLEAQWLDAGIEMRLYVYFGATDNNKWKVTEMRTYNGQNPGNWIYYTGTESAKLGTPFTNNQHSRQSNDVKGYINFGQIELQPFFKAPTPTPTPKPFPVSRVFLTSKTYNGNLGGLTGADAKCQASADAVKLGGTWKAFLSDSKNTASNRLVSSKGPYQLLNGTVIVKSWLDVINKPLLAPIIVTELKTTFNPPYAWSNIGSTLNALTPKGQTCNDWTGTLGSGLVGKPAGFTNSNWRRAGIVSCADSRPLYCIEQLGTPCGTFGDVDLDNKITLADANLVLKYLAGGTVLSDDQKKRADVNFVKGVDSGDVTQITFYASGKIKTFPACGN